MESGSGAPGTDLGGDEPSPELDVHAAAALDRLMRWAAKALRADAAAVTIAERGGTVLASATGTAKSRRSPRLSVFAAQILRDGQPHAIDGQPRAVGDARPRASRDDEDSIAFLGAPLTDRDGHAVGSFCVMDSRPRRWTIQDIELVSELTSSAMTELDLHATRAEAAREKRWSDRQQGVLELIAARAPLQRTLSELLSAAETHAPGLLAVFTRLERARGGPDRLRVIADHGLPRSFTSALDGVAVTEGASISSNAALHRQPIEIRNLAEAGLEPSYVALAHASGLHAGWSTPILSRNGTVLGTFTIYHASTRDPDEYERVLVDRSVHLARLAIEQVDGAAALRR
ncbi:MAG: GAF domain-containing protein, partial [Solirubrobacteraceae bacterium]